jgi:hypothetical protein
LATKDNSRSRPKISLDSRPISTERYGQELGPPTGGEVSWTTNRFGLLYSNGAGVDSPRGPWVGGHYFVIPNLSIGATIGFEIVGGSRTTTSGAVSRTVDLPERTAVVVLPKVGYALMFNDTIGFWFRGGPGYVSSVATQPPAANGVSVSQHTYFWVLSLDALFVVSPVQHFAFYVGPQAELSLAGAQTSRPVQNVTTSIDTSYRSLGIGLGLIGYFNL